MKHAHMCGREGGACFYVAAKQRSASFMFQYLYCKMGFHWNYSFTTVKQHNDVYNYLLPCYTHNMQFPHLLNPHSLFCHHTVMNAECIVGLPLVLHGDTETCFLDKQ